MLYSDSRPLIMASETGEIENAHIKQANIKAMMPAFHFFLYRNQATVKIKMNMKNPGGSKKGIITFLNISICQFPLPIRALMFRQDHRIKMILSYLFTLCL
jgi:hypothetical protein